MKIIQHVPNVIGNMYGRGTMHTVVVQLESSEEFKFIRKKAKEAFEFTTMYSSIRHVLPTPYKFNICVGNYDMKNVMVVEWNETSSQATLQADYYYETLIQYLLNNKHIDEIDLPKLVSEYHIFALESIAKEFFIFTNTDHKNLNGVYKLFLSEAIKQHPDSEELLTIRQEVEKFDSFIGRYAHGI